MAAERLDQIRCGGMMRTTEPNEHELTEEEILDLLDDDRDADWDDEEAYEWVR
ncbi:hypothetical protein GCM10010218_41800 [Streptomyces mashuensis]|uniref:Uncharacterized protein n=1 Tax=Streptomyces mashuensis TaxID=33904 RepID=A0A919B4M1_9ACTN|nr:hypothetical protein GCM10010218_41800 [Streptomyces mashuensis]